MTIQLLPINRETDLPIKALIRQVGDALPTALSDVCRELPTRCCPTTIKKVV